jgi:hypothetical protein
MVVVAFLPGLSAMLRPFLPVLVSLVLGLAIVLNFGGHFAVAFACRKFMKPATAQAAAQFPIYATPAVFGRRK